MTIIRKETTMCTRTSSILAGVCITTAVVALAAAPASARSSFPKYVLTDLGTLGGERSSASGINDAGQVVGWSATEPGSSHLSNRAFLWQDGTIIDLGTIGAFSSATAINNSGVIVGNSQGIPWIWDDGIMSEIVGVGSQNVQARDINDMNVVLGTSTGASWLWDDGRVTLIPIYLDGDEYLFLRRINNAGQVVGFIEQMDDHAGPAIIWQDGEITEIGTLGSFGFAMGVAINNLGVAVGEAAWDVFGIGKESVPWRWENGVMTQLPGGWPENLNTHPRAISDEGVVVGTLTTLAEDDYEWSGFITDGIELADLNTLIAAGSGWHITQARGINAAGQIVGEAIPPGATQWWEHRAVLLTPAAPSDLNLDGSVDVFDLLILLAAWGECDDPAPGNCPADLDGNGVVDVFDLLILLANWGA